MKFIQIIIISMFIL